MANTRFVSAVTYGLADRIFRNSGFQAVPQKNIKVSTFTVMAGFCKRVVTGMG